MEGFMERVASELSLQNSPVRGGSPGKRDQQEPRLKHITSHGASQ